MSRWIWWKIHLQKYKKSVIRVLGVLCTDSNVWLDGVRPADTCILPSFPVQTWSLLSFYTCNYSSTALQQNHCQKYVCKYKNLAVIKFELNSTIKEDGENQRVCRDICLLFPSKHKMTSFRGHTSSTKMMSPGAS